VSRRSFSIRLHLAIYGALILLPLVAAGLVITKFYVDKERATLEAQAHQIVADATLAIDQDLSRYKLALEVLAASSGLSEGKFEQLYLRAQALSESVPDSFIALRRDNGETIFLTTDPFGEPIPTTADAGLRAADKLAIEHRSPVITDLVSAGTGRSNVVALEVPIATDNKVDYLLTLGIAPKGMLDILTARIKKSGWLLAATDNNDRIIARSWDNERFAGEKASDEFIRNTQGKTGTFIGQTSEGVPVLNVYRRSDLSGWKVAAGIPLPDLEAPLYRSLSVLGIVGAIVLLTSFILAVLYGRLLTRPLRQLQGVADARSDEKAVPTGIAELDGVAGVLMRSIVVLKDRDRSRARTIKELNHRMKNMLAIVQAIASETRRRAPSLEQFGRAFDGRLAALARSHEALGHPEWHSGELHNLILQTCKPFCDESRLELQGPSVELPPKATIGIGMIIHELATNAAKYGALSNAAGKVLVRWDMPEEGGLRVLRLQWQEEDGPEIENAHKEGFGSVLLRSIIEGDLGGKLDMIFARDGVHCIICIPMSGLMGPSIVPQDADVEAAGAERQ
jgi:two-component sensor histidine kinase